MYFEEVFSRYLSQNEQCRATWAITLTSPHLKDVIVLSQSEVLEQDSTCLINIQTGLPCQLEQAYVV